MPLTKRSLAYRNWCLAERMYSIAAQAAYFLKNRLPITFSKRPALSFTGEGSAQVVWLVGVGSSEKGDEVAQCACVSERGEI